MKMGKNDFDIDFNFEEEYDFDPKAFLGTEEYDEDIDLSVFSDEELGLNPEPAVEEEEADSFDLDDALNLDDFLNMGSEEEEAEEEEEEELSYEPEEEEAVYEEEAPEYEEDEEEEPVYEEAAYEEELSEKEVYQEEEPDILAVRERTYEEAPVYEEPEYEQPEEYEETQDVFEDEPVAEEYDEEEESQRTQRKKREPIKMPKVTLPAITLPKFTTPKFLIKFYDLYFAPVLDKSLIEEPQDPANPRRRRRKSKMQIFKEVYLPPILVCVTAILVLSFCIGALSNAIEDKRLKDKQKENEIQASEDAAALKEQQYQQLIAEADELAAGYNYEDALALLNSFGDSSEYPELENKKNALYTAQQQLTQHSEPSLIPNLSFQVLIEDLPRALSSQEFGGSYNKNFVSTGEFKAILNQLYANGYVLVDFDSFTEVSTDLDGNVKVQMKPIYLPADKKPIMLTETMVNYYGYMIDENKDGTIDGGGFASKLVLQNGKIKAEYVDANRQTLVGDYDLIPILETFIEEHPDFSYQGARAIVAVTGYEGIFGYRTNTSYIATKGQAYYDQECADAKEVVQALKDAGYTLACFTYDNIAYRDKSSAQITADMQLWTQQITPIIGEIDTFVFARESNLSDYSEGSTSLNVLKTSGFRYFVSNGTQPWAEVNSSYVRQNRLMVTGKNMQHYKDQFTGIFDCAAVLDVNVRGNVPN